jgi:putative membrane protein
MSTRYGDAVSQPERPAPPTVDTRFLLANERTLLAWVRTALALLAAGGGVYEFTDVSGRRVLAVCIAAIGIAAAAAGAARYAATARAIRAGEPMTMSRAPELLALAVAALGIGLIVALLAA